MNSKYKNRELVTYFAITILVTWILWTPSVLKSMGFDVSVALLIISMMASFTPSIVGFAMHKRGLGKSEFKRDMERRFNFEFSKLWLIGIPVLFFALGGLSYFMTLTFVSEFQPMQTIPWAMTPLVFLQILFIGGALGEEMGWRGFAQPRMNKLMSPFLVSLILGLAWSLWHLPLFFMDGTVQSTMPIWQFMLQNTLMAYFYTWLYNKTKGNMWLMIYLHAVANTSAAIFPYWQSNQGRMIGFTVLFIACVILYVVRPIRDGNNY